MSIVSTTGPHGDKGLVMGGTGEYESAVGSMYQTMTFREVSRDGPRVDVVETFAIRESRGPNDLQHLTAP
jgi:hypothetical protein